MLIAHLSTASTSTNVLTPTSLSLSNLHTITVNSKHSSYTPTKYTSSPDIWSFGVKASKKSPIAEHDVHVCFKYLFSLEGKVNI
jgi:hypothetical protein